MFIYDLKDLINQSPLVKLFDSIEVNQLPLNDTDASSQTNVVLSPIMNTPSVWGSNDFNSMYQQAQVMIYYSLDFDEPIEVVEIKLMRFIQDNGWTVSDKSASYIDDVTGKTVSTIKFEREFEVSAYEL